MMTKIWLFTMAALGLATAAFADTQPQSGTWAGQVAFDSQTGCPPQMVAQLQAGQPGYANQQIFFPSPFDPVALQGNDPNFVWSKRATDVWEGTHSEIQQTGLGTLTVVGRSIVTVQTPVQISQAAEVTVNFPQAMAQMMGMATTTCVMRHTVSHFRTGP